MLDNFHSRQADEGHTTVEFLLQFNDGQKGSTEKLRKIVKTGDIAGISVDADFFEIKGKQSCQFHHHFIG